MLVTWLILRRQPSNDQSYVRFSISRLKKGSKVGKSTTNTSKIWLTFLYFEEFKGNDCTYNVHTWIKYWIKFRFSKEDTKIWQNHLDSLNFKSTALFRRLNCNFIKNLWSSHKTWTVAVFKKRIYLKFSFSEKATKIWSYLPIVLTNQLIC